jgi:DNA-binding NtrC family response regulator
VPTETVLVLDDDEHVLHAMIRMLQRLGYVVLAASSGAEAIAALVSHPEPIQLLITDLQLPGSSGVEVAQQAQQLRPGLRTLLVSGSDDIEGLVILQKPFSLAALRQKVREALDTP